MNQLFATFFWQVGHGLSIRGVVGEVVGGDLLGSKSRNTKFLDSLGAIVDRKIGEVDRWLATLYLGKLQQRLALSVFALSPAFGLWPYLFIFHLLSLGCWTKYPIDSRVNSRL